MCSPFIFANFALIGCFIALAGVVIGSKLNAKNDGLKSKEADRKMKEKTSESIGEEEQRIVEVKRQEYLNFLNYNGDEMPDPEKTI